MPEYERIYDTTAALLEGLEELAQWADANIYDVPIELPDALRQAADVIWQVESRRMNTVKMELNRRKNVGTGG